MGYPLPLKVMGIGYAVPSKVVESKELEAQYGLEPGWCEQRQGIARRYWAVDETVTSLGSEAAREAVREAQLEMNDIDLLISATSTVENFIPGQDILFKRALNMQEDVPTMRLNTGCLNALNALDLAANYVASGMYKHVLIICATISSRDLQFDDATEDISLLADGASAIVVGKSNDGEASCLLAAHSATYAADQSAQSMGKGEDIVVFSKDVQLQDIEYSVDAKYMQTAGAKYNFKFLKALYPISNKTIDWVIPNQSTKLASDMMRLVFSKEKILSIVHDYGNMGPVGYYLALYCGYQEGKIKRGDIILMNGIGAGISLSGIVLRF